MTSVRKSYRSHTKKRAKQRYGVTLNNAKIQKIVSMIHQGRVVRDHGRLTNSRSMFDVCLDGQVMRVVYSKTTKTLVTVLPL